MVVKTKTLFDESHFTGFINHQQGNFIDIILKHAEYRLRDRVEQDEQYQQPIAYTLVQYSQSFFVYQRAKVGDTRLQGKWSLGIGGHIERQDAGRSPIITSLQREVREELGVEPREITLLGYINEDKTSVDRVHFGLLYKTVVDKPITKSKEIAQGDFMTPQEITGANLGFEEWSKLLLSYLPGFLQYSSN